jgi:hypothetical protein
MARELSEIEKAARQRAAAAIAREIDPQAGGFAHRCMVSAALKGMEQADLAATVRILDGTKKGVELGFIAMQLLAGAECGNHAESSMEGAMTDAGLTAAQKRELGAEATAAEEIRKMISLCNIGDALYYCTYMGPADMQALARELLVLLAPDHHSLRKLVDSTNEKAALPGQGEAAGKDEA